MRFFGSKKVVPLRKEELTVFEDVNNLSYNLRLIGLFPLTLENDKFRISTNLLLITLMVLINTAIIDLYFVHNIDLNMSVEILRYLSPFEHFFIESANLSLLHFLSQIRLLNKCLQNVFLVDNYLKTIGCARKREGSFHSMFAAVILLMIVLTFLIRSLLKLSLPYSGKLLAIYWPSVIVVFYLQEVTGILALLRSGFMALLEPLSAFPMDTKRLEQLAKAHHILCRSGNHLNHIFSITFLTMAASGFAFFVCELYSFYYIAQAKWNFFFLLIKLSWCSIGLIWFWQLAFECENTTKKVSIFLHWQKFMTKEDSVVFSLFLSFLCCFPFSRSGRVFRFSCLRFLLYITLLALFAQSTLYSFRGSNIPWEGPFEKVMFFSSSFIHTAALCLSLFSIVWARRAVNLPFLHLDLAVARLRRVGLSPKIRHPKLIASLGLLVPTLVCLPETYVTVIHNPHWYLSVFFNYIKLLFVYQLLFRVIGSFSVARTLLRFSKLTLALLGDGVHYIGKTDKIVSLAHAHSHICSTCFYFNDIFSTALLAAIATAFICTIVGIYFIIILSKTWTTTSIRNFIIISKAIQLLGFGIFVGFLVQTCAKCKTEAREFNTLLYQLMIDDKTNEILNNQKLRLHISMKREVVFTACGFFTLDYTLVHSMIASATTYLVILIQFGQQSTPTAPPLLSDLSNITGTPFPPHTLTTN